MTDLPQLTGKKLVNLLKKSGFAVVRSKGSHFVLKSEDGRMTVVPVHSGETIGPGLLSKILQDCELTREDLKKLLK
ncbi:type II toxin-antitoxin system HicA family toxin [Nitrospina gracilis]|uniref:type II toxin-antitoxin system HicA family toxin n=1 Tax=Nitrospina gracilis TaxID=35801 RepID=UPI001F01F825|nr:putative RNA binding protein YcfA (HicA-like mRNA interferase family) [Nitrospina gracilis Nb-211]